MMDCLQWAKRADQGLKMDKDNNQNLSKEKLLAEIALWYNRIKAHR
jgi:hypothetical protein